MRLRLADIFQPDENGMLRAADLELVGDQFADSGTTVSEFTHSGLDSHLYSPQARLGAARATMRE